MGEHRMFSEKIINSDSFLDMPHSTQTLYFHLGMKADDEGFIDNPKAVMRHVKCNEDDLRLLFAKKYIIPFESGVVVVTHWRIHNKIRSDRKKDTTYIDEKSQLEIDKDGSYILSNDIKFLKIK